MKLLVTGGTGLVGNALQKVCPNAIYVSSEDNVLNYLLCLLLYPRE